MSVRRDAIVLYVSPHGSDSWSGRFPQPASDGQDGPLATLPRAIKAVRQLRSAQRFVRQAEIRMRGGFYHISSPVVLTPEDSYIDILSHDGEQASLSGGVRVTGWRETTVHGRSAWVCDAAGILAKYGYVHQLFVNGRRAVRPRMPKTGVYWMEDVPGVEKTETDNRAPVQKNRFVASCGHFAEFRNIEDVEVVVPHWWIEDRRRVKSYDPVRRLVTLAEDAQSPFVDDLNPAWARYYVENMFEALTEPGEWYLDRAAATMYYLPLPGETIADVHAFISVNEQLLILAGEPEQGRFVEGVTFRGIAIEHGEWKEVNRSHQAACNVPAAVRWEGARNCAMEDCAIRHVGVWALELGRGCVNNRIVGCAITDIGGGGIRVGGVDIHGPASCRTYNTRITDNDIGPVGIVHHSATGVLLTHTYNNVVAHNHIHDLFYTGVSVGFVWGYGPNISCNNRIEKNHIHHCGQKLLNDMGGIYLLGVQPGTTIRGNLIHDIMGHMYGGWGIYPDEGSSHIVIENNIVYNTSSQLFHLHFGRENAVRNNIWAFANEGLIAISRGPRLQWPDKQAFNDGHSTCSFVFERNIVITNGQPIFVGGMDDATGNIEERPFISDLNVFYDVNDQPVTSVNAGHLMAHKGVRRSFTWEEMRKLGYDRHSVVADPKVGDLRNNDFRLAPDSPALAMGFTPIDMSDVGPRPFEKRTGEVNDCRESPWIGFQ